MDFSPKKSSLKGNVLRLSCGAAGNGNVCHGYLEIKGINIHAIAIQVSLLHPHIPMAPLWAHGDGGCWRNISERALLRCSVLNKEPKRDLQVKLSPHFPPRGKRGSSSSRGAEKRAGGSWWVTGEELLGAGWWKMLWKILSVFQCQ